MKLRVIGSINYKNKNYCVLINKRLDRYYAILDENNNLLPLSLEEYLEIKNYVIKNSLSNNKAVRIGDTVDINPMVKIGKKLVPLVLAINIMLSMSGCANGKSGALDVFSDNGIEISTNIDDTDMYYINSIDNSKLSEDNKLGISKSFLEDCSYDVSCTPNELSNYIKYEEITWDDVIKAIKDNKNITDEIEVKLLSGINNLKNSDMKYNLYPLYYNIQKLDIEYCDRSNFNNYEAATFNCNDAKVAINKDMINDQTFDFVLFHEIIGHGSQAAFINDKNKIIYCSNNPFYVVIDTNGDLNHIGKLGDSFNEATADFLASKALNKKKDCKFGTGYDGLNFYFNLIINSNNCTYSDFINNGVDYLIEKMKDNKLSDCYQTVVIGDNELFCCYNQSESDALSFVEGIAMYLFSLIDKKFEEGLSKEEVYEYIIQLVNSNKKIMKYAKYDDRDCFLAYDFAGQPEVIFVDDIVNLSIDYINGNLKIKK